VFNIIKTEQERAQSILKNRLMMHCNMMDINLWSLIGARRGVVSIVTDMSTESVVVLISCRFVNV